LDEEWRRRRELSRLKRPTLKDNFVEIETSSLKAVRGRRRREREPRP
jgi:hypothetical protein